jgi:hypothetical protein
MSLFSTVVMEHYPRNFPKVRAHLGEGLFDVVIKRAILIPNSEQNCESIKTTLINVLHLELVLPPRNCGICPYRNSSRAHCNWSLSHLIRFALY